MVTNVDSLNTSEGSSPSPLTQSVVALRWLPRTRSAPCLQWPSTQTSPQLSATVTLLSGQITAGATEDLRDANKALKFAKMNNDVGFHFRPLGQISDMVLVAMTDASWGILDTLRDFRWSSYQLHHFGSVKFSFAPHLQKLIECRVRWTVWNTPVR